MKRNSVPVGSLPNSSLLTDICEEVFNEFRGYSITPERIALIKDYINLAIRPLIDAGEWATISLLNNRIIEYKEVLVIQDEINPSGLRIIPLWQYAEEEEDGADSSAPDTGYMES